MRKALITTLFFSLVVVVSFGFGRVWSDRQAFLLQKEEEVNNGFKPTNYPIKQCSFVFFVCGYNNGAFVERTLRSLFSQAYDSYRLIYVDDASTDGSFEVAKDAIYASQELSRTTIIRNEERLGALANLVRAVETCRDDEILVLISDCDWLAHEWVLTTLNSYYADPDLWLAFARICEYPSYQSLACSNYTVREWKSLRNAPFKAKQLISFYASLFQEIPQEDLMDQGSYFTAAIDMAIGLPMLELSEQHFQFLPEILAVFNRQAPVQTDPEIGSRSEKIIRSFKPLEPLASLQFNSSEEEN